MQEARGQPHAPGTSSRKTLENLVEYLLRLNPRLTRWNLMEL